MEVVGLVSGGKDSCYNMMLTVNQGNHKIVALANLYPPIGKEEIDSYMYQSVGSDGVQLYGEAMDVPLYRRVISGLPMETSLNYEKTKDDEVEDLFELLKEVKEKHPNLKGVSVGAILSSYQKLRVENVCDRLNLVPLCFLWERDQKELLSEMITNNVRAILIKVAAIGLGKEHLGKTLDEMRPKLLELSDKYGVHPCGEGGEYETFVMDCPLFKKRIIVEESEVVIHQNDPVAPVSYLKFVKLGLETK